MAYSLVQRVLRLSRHNKSPQPAATAEADLCARRAFRELVGRRSGVVRHLQNCEPNASDFPLKFVAGECANPATDSMNESMNVGGAGANQASATMAALGEGLERYSAGCQQCHEIRFSSVSDLGGDYISAAEFAPFSKRQRQQQGFPFPAVEDTDQIGWLHARLLGDIPDAGTLHTAAENCWVPASAVYLPYVPRRGEPLIAPGLSTGLACSNNLANALLSGLLEVIERDAVAAMWRLRITPRRIAHETVVELSKDLIPRESGQRLQAFDLTSDLDVPTVMVLDHWPDESLPPVNSRQHSGARQRGARQRGARQRGTNQQYGRILSVGTACHPCPKRALRKAVIEAGQGRIYVRQLQTLDPTWTPGDRFENVSDFAAHARFYTSRPDLIQAAFRFITESNQRSEHFVAQTKSPRDHRDAEWSVAQLRTIRKRLHSLGHRISWIELTPPGAKQIPMTVVRVLVPSLLPLHGHHHLALDEHPRLLDSRLRASGACPELSPYPHPFP